MINVSVLEREKEKKVRGGKAIIKSYCMPAKTLRSGAFAWRQSHFSARVLFSLTK